MTSATARLSIRPRPSSLDLAGIYAVIEREPGILGRDLAKRLGRHPDNIDGLLVTLENHGYLLSEEQGRLYPRWW